MKPVPEAGRGGRHFRTRLSGWGRHPVLDCRLEHLRRAADLRPVLERCDTLIARGNGRSYGDAALNPHLTLSLLALDRMQEFDATTGLLTCESGVLLADVLQVFAPRGWFPPVVPGTRFVTIGGMIAADVHGKNHQRDGSFGAYVESLTLASADGEPRRCSRTHDAELFRATIGGMGLTGVILSASFRLLPIESAFVMTETVATPDLDAAMATLEASADWPYRVAWVDGLAAGAKLGRALVTRGAFMERRSLPPRWAADPLPPAAAGSVPVPFDLPRGALNRVSMGVFNGLRYRCARTGAGPAHWERFFFPLDRIGAWNRLYGRRGFLQYQCVLPLAESQAGVAALLERIAASGQGAFLAVLKRFGAARPGLLSFPMEGYSLALDFPLRRGTPELLDALDEITHARGGRVYLAKDACCKPERFRQGYAEWSAFDTIRNQAAPPARKFASALSRRLAL